MMARGALDVLPLWGLFLATLIVILLSVEAGYRLGKRRRALGQEEMEAPVGSMVGVTLGLLAFMLAFTFSMGAERFEARRRVLLEETNAIGTAYLRAGLLPDPQQSEIRRLLREYVDARLEGVQPGRLAHAMQRSEELHGLLWSQAVAAAAGNPGSIMAGLFVQSLNEVIDVHSKRVQASLRSRIPTSIWGTLYVLAVLGVSAMGYHAGLTGSSRSLAVLALALAFSSVMLLISDLDRPQEGLLKVSQQLMIDLRNSINAQTP